MESQASTFTSFLRKPVGSAISDLLTEQPKLVEREIIEPQEEEAPNTVNPFDKALARLVGNKDEPEEKAYEPQTAEEIRTKARTKTELWAAGISLAVSVLNKWVAQQNLRRGDQELIDDYEYILESTGSYPIHPQEHPYHAARRRYTLYEEQLDKVVDDARLDDDQKDMLQKAITADLKARNDKGKLDQAGIAMTLLEIGGAKAMEPVSGYLLMWMSRGNK